MTDFIPRRLSYRCLVIYLQLFTWFGAEMVFTPGRFHPGAEDRDEIVPG